MSAAPMFDRAAVPSALRRPAAWLAALSAVAVAALGIRYEGLTAATDTDRILGGAIDGWVPGLGRLLQLIPYLGNPTSVVVLAVLLAALAMLAGRRRLALLAMAGPGLTGVATTVLKPIFDRTHRGALAYPSGHTAALTALAIVAALLLIGRLRAGAWTKAMLVLMIGLAAGFAMAVALTSLGIHYPTDTIGGFGTAVAVVIGAALLLDRLAEARARRRT